MPVANPAVASFSDTKEEFSELVLVPIALLGHLTSILKPDFVMALLSCSALFLLVLAIRKFGMDAAADVGDKSVFDYLDRQQTSEAL